MSLFGIEIGSHSVKAVVMEKRFRGIEPVKMVRRATGETKEETVSAIRDILELNSYDPEEDRMAVLLPASYLSYRLLNFPFDDNKRIGEALLFEIESQTPFDADEIVADYIVVEKTESGSKVLASLSLKSNIDSFLATLREAGGEPDVLIPHHCATAMAAMEDNNQTEGIVASIDIGLRSTSISFVKDGRIYDCHSVDTGSESATEEKEGYAKNIASESLRLLLSHGVRSLGGVLLSGGISHDTQLANALEGYLKAPISKPSNGSLDNVLLDDDPAFSRKAESWLFSAALAAGTIMANKPKNLSMNFLTGEYEKRRKIAGGKSMALTTAILLALVPLAAGASYLLEGALLQQKYDGLKTNVRSEFTRALPEVKRIVSETQQLKNGYADLLLQKEQLGFALSENDPLLDRLFDITSSVPPGIRLDIDSFSYEAMNITMKGRTGSFENVERLKSEFDKLPWTETVTVTGAKASVTPGSIDFDMELVTER